MKKKIIPHIWKMIKTSLQRQKQDVMEDLDKANVRLEKTRYGQERSFRFAVNWRERERELPHT
jgi:hypothetical protein